MVVSKNQIRPRRKKFHFSNAEILLLDTVGFIKLVTPVKLGQVLLLDSVQARSNIKIAYGNVGVASAITIFDDFSGGLLIEDDGAGVTDFTDLFTNADLNLFSGVGPGLVDDANETVVSWFTNFWTDEADLLANGGISMGFSNSGDLNAGDVANYLDIFIDYKIVNLNINQ